MSSMALVVKYIGSLMTVKPSPYLFKKTANCGLWSLQTIINLEKLQHLGLKRREVE